MNLHIIPTDDQHKLVVLTGEYDAHALVINTHDTIEIVMNRVKKLEAAQRQEKERSYRNQEIGAAKLNRGYVEKDKYTTVPVNSPPLQVERDLSDEIPF